jgi:hypothetical protein
VKLRVAVRVPEAEGLNTTLTEQLLAAARLAPQPLLEMVKSEELAPVIETPLMEIEALLPFFRAVDIAELVPPRVTLPKERDEGLVLTLDAPDPESATVCGLLLAVSVKVRVAERVPDADGLKTTAAAQLEDLTRVEPHVLLDMVKSAALAPEMAMLLIEMDELVPLDNVADCDALLDPMLRVPNERVDGLIATLPVVLVPRPDTAMVCGLPLPLSVKLSVAERVPDVDGAKTTLTVQLAEAAKLVLHVLEKI